MALLPAGGHFLAAAALPFLYFDLLLLADLALESRACAELVEDALLHLERLGRRLLKLVHVSEVSGVAVLHPVLQVTERRHELAWYARELEVVGEQVDHRDV
eukprot:scaffold82382_cov72-Phaeocystis_antarctica.AAC.3